ncbi:MAG TPA: hypothetical protein VNA14_00460 [Mycobacteriales bacterium]|nr:hypothetical protein [Mycobacteriales bacterium]
MTAEFDRLLVCLEHYQAARLDHEDATARLAEDRSDQAAREQIAASEALIDARVQLYSCLVQAGWDPPAEVRAELVVDATVIGLTTGALTP